MVHNNISDENPDNLQYTLVIRIFILNTCCLAIKINTNNSILLNQTQFYNYLYSNKSIIINLIIFILLFTSEYFLLKIHVESVLVYRRKYTCCIKLNISYQIICSLWDERYQNIVLAMGIFLTILFKYKKLISVFLDFIYKK